jgi:hypothetical protein
MSGYYKKFLIPTNYTFIDSYNASAFCLFVAARSHCVQELAEVLAVDCAGGIPKPNEDWRSKDQEQAVLATYSSFIDVVNFRIPRTWRRITGT